MVKKRGIVGFILQNFGFFRNKEALSNVVASLIIILLVIVAAGIIWVVVRNVVQSGSEQIEFGKFMFDLTIKNAFIDGQEVKVDVRRSPGGGDLIGVKFIFLDDSGSSHLVERKIALEQLEQRRFAFTSEEVGGISLVRIVSIAPVYESSGKEVAGDITDTAVIRESPPEGGNGGDNGDGEENGEENGDEGGTPGVECDESNPCAAGYECVGGVCSDCIYAEPENACSSEFPEYQCGTAYVCGVLASCGSCGFGEFCSSHLCVGDTIINSGVVHDVFTSQQPFQFFSTDLPWVYELDLRGKYINFSIVGGCFWIQFHGRLTDELKEITIDYVTFEEVIDGLASGPGSEYTVWNTTQCGS